MEEVHYCSDPALVRVYPDVPEGLRRLKAAGLATVIITNQSGIGRGLFTESQYHAVQEELIRQIGAGLIDASYFCPDVPGAGSTRRKPEPGMVLEAAEEHGINLACSFFIGDACSDIECGRRAGVCTLLVLTGYGVSARCDPDVRAPNFSAAVEVILHRLPYKTA
jgi:D-glycero-D-manno-heptose 1,7-bisphosphate phosphatase